MQTPPTFHYMLCHMIEEKVELIQTHQSEAELIEAYDNFAEDNKCVAIIWIQSNNESKLFWIIKENILDLEDDGINLLMQIYSQVFGFEDEWSNENV
jgi:hypothetical protein